MARKTLITESELRRFMKLANMAPVGDTKMENWYPGARDEEEVEVGAAELDAGGEVDDMVDIEAAVEEPAPMPELEPEPEGGDITLSLDDFMDAFKDALETTTGDKVEWETDSGASEEVTIDAEDEEGGETEDSPEASLGEPGEASAIAMADEELPGGLEEARLVNKVAARVAARLVKENRKTQMTEELTERIFKRLTQK